MEKKEEDLLIIHGKKKEEEKIEADIRELENNIQDEMLREILISLREGKYRYFEDLGGFKNDYVLYETIKIFHKKLLNSYGFKRDENNKNIYKNIYIKNLVIVYHGFFYGKRRGYILSIFSDYPYWMYCEAHIKWEYRIDINYLKAVNTMISDLDQFMKDEVERINKPTRGFSIDEIGTLRKRRL